MNNIVNNSIEALTNIEKEIKDRKWMEVIIDVVSITVLFSLSALFGQTLWNNSIPKLFPMLGKAGLYDVLVLHVLLN